MTERSMFWADGIGDGGPYSQDQLRLLYDALAAADAANRGVLVRQGNGLDPSSTGVNNIRMAIGKAVVDGTLYENDAILDIVTASPVIGVTGRRLVLQKDWTARTVRAAIITSADGVAAIPALTQNDGVIWEIPIASFTITLGGVIGPEAGAQPTDTRELSGTSPPTQLVRKKANQTIDSDTSLNDDDHLRIPVAANEIWIFEACLYVGGPTAADIKIAFDVPAGATLIWSGLGLATPATFLTDVTFAGVETVDDNPIAFGLITGTDTAIRIWGTLENGANAGDLLLRWAQRVFDGSGCTIFKNSWLKAIRIQE